MTTPDLLAYDQPIDLAKLRAGLHRTLFCVPDIESLIFRSPGTVNPVLSFSAIQVLMKLVCPPANPGNFGQLLIGSPVLDFDAIMKLNPYAAWKEWLDDYICGRVRKADSRPDIELEFSYLNERIPSRHSQGMIDGRKVPISVYLPRFSGEFRTPLEGWCDILTVVADMTVQPYYSDPPSNLADMLSRGLIGTRHPESPDAIAVVNGRWDQLDIRVFGPAASTV